MNRRCLAIARWQAWLLAVLLLAAQGAGLSHRLAHGGAHGGAQGVAVAQGAGPQDAHAGHDEGSPECRLVDQLAHADALCSGETATPPALTVALAAPARTAGRPAQGAAAAYLARAPPRG